MRSRGHVDDPDRLAHVEDEDLAAFPHGPRLEDQLRRLGDAHEVAPYVGVGHRHGPPAGDLFLEDGNGRAGAAEDVAETDGHELVTCLAVHALDEKLCDAFGGAHDVGGPHGLVRRDEDKPLYLRFQGQVDEVARPQDVVQDRLPGVVLLHRHVLVGRGVKDDVGFEALQDPLQGIAVADVRKEALRGQRTEPQLKFLLDLEQVQLAEVEKPHDLGLKTADLPDELGTDGASRARDQDPLAAEKAADPLRIEVDFLPSYEILQPHLPDGIRGDAPLDELADLGDGAIPLARPVADLDDPPHHIAPRRGDGDEDLVELDRQLSDVVDGAQDWNAVDRLALLAGVVVEETHRAVLDPGVVLDLPQHLLGGISRAHDEQPRPLFTVRVEKGEVGRVEETRRDGLLDVYPDQQADPADEHQGDQGIQDEDASRKPLEAPDENQGQCNGPRADHGCRDDVDEVRDARVAPHAAIQADPREDRNLQQDDPWQSLREQRHLLRRDIAFEADDVGQHVGGADQTHVDDEDDPEIPISKQVFHLSCLFLRPRTTGPRR